MHTKPAACYWITGAASGIGRQLAVRLCNEGHKVVVSGRRREPLETLVDRYPGQVTVMQVDVSDDQAMADLFNENAPEQLDGIFLCAGICEYIDMPELDAATIRRVTNVNFHGVVNSCVAALPLLFKAADKGKKPFIAGVSSMSTYVGFPRAEAYGAAKAAMAYFLDSLRCDIGKRVDVTVVYPGFVETPLTSANDFPMPTMVTADYAAEYILKHIDKRPLLIRFPWRLHVMLKLAARFPTLWYRWLAPRLSRTKPRQAREEYQS